MKRHVVQNGAVALSVVEEGPDDAPVIVLVHGYPDSHVVWDGVAASLSKRFHMVRYDVRGAGASTAPPGKTAYSLEHLSTDLESVIDATSGGRRVHVVGHDWGGIQAWEAVTEPRIAAKIASFTTISGPCLDHVGHWLRENLKEGAVGRISAQAVRSWYVYLFQLPVVPELVWRAGLSRVWQRQHERPTLAEDAKHGLALYRENVIERLLSPRERRTDIPVQIVTLRGDAFVAPESFRGVERWAPKAFIRNAVGGHWIIRERPERCAQWIAELVDQVEGTKGAARLLGARQGEVVVITGAASGIGRATAFAFADRGARLVLADIDREGVERTALLASHLGATATTAVVDVGNQSAMERFAADVARDYGAPDVVVNNAGIGLAGPFLETTPSEWERALRVNLWGVLHGCRLFGAQMVARGEGGHIVNVASAAAFAPQIALPAYATTKAAVLMLTECLRAELAAEEIGVSAICPGVIDTPIAASTTFAGATAERQEKKRRAATRLYQKRGLGPDVVARAIVRAVDNDEAVVPVSIEAHAMSLMARYAPGLSRRLARIDLTPG